MVEGGFIIPGGCKIAKLPGRKTEFVLQQGDEHGRKQMLFFLRKDMQCDMMIKVAVPDCLRQLYDRDDYGEAGQRGIAESTAYAFPDGMDVFGRCEAWRFEAQL